MELRAAFCILSTSTLRRVSYERSPSIKASVRPLIAGLAYELIRFAGKHSDHRVLMTLLAPGMWLQRLTTRQPTLDQIEVSIRALREVLHLEETRSAENRVEVMA